MSSVDLHRGQNNPGVLHKFMSLSQGNKIQAEYVWIDGSGEDLRSKTRTLEAPKPGEKLTLPEWNFDGSSTGQARTETSEVLLVPVKFVPDPFRGKPNIIVLCECCDPATGQAIDSNKRAVAKKIFDNKDVADAETWWGIEQEYTLYENDGSTPLGWPRFGFPGPQGPYYCGVGARKAYGRRIVEAHYRCCLYSGLNISGCNAEVMPGQWEFQVGPCVGLDSGDQLWLARYLLTRVSESFDTVVSFNPKPVPGDWNGAGCHTNFSTKAMREKGGLEVIEKSMKNMEKRHKEHILLYGKDNALRLTGRHETASIEEFSYGVGHRGASIRIPSDCAKKGCGYFEDRRPAANMDPYLVTGKIAETVILDPQESIFNDQIATAKKE